MYPNDASPISKKITYRKRKKTLKKKAEELSILCGIPVGLLCIESDGKVEIWPEDRKQVDEIIQQYLVKTNKSTVAPSIAKPVEQVKEKKRKLRYETWNSNLDYLSEEELIEILEYVQRKEKLLDERMRMEKNRKMERGLGVQIRNDSKSSSSFDSENTEELI